METNKFSSLNEEREQPPTRPKQKSLGGKFFGVLAAVFLVVSLASLGVANAVMDMQYQNKIDQGVSISGIYVGEMTRDEARSAITKQMQGFNDRPVILDFQDKKWQPTLEQLGVTINYEASLDKAFEASKSGDFFKDLRLAKALNPETKNVPIEVMVNETKLNGFLSDISDRIRRDPVEPIIDIKDGKLVVTEGKVGFNVLYDKTFSSIKDSLLSLKPSSQNLLQVGDIPTVISQQEFNDFKDKLTAMVSTPVIVSFKDKSWNIDQTQLMNIIKVQRTVSAADPKHFRYTVDRTFVEKFVTGLVPTITQQPKNGDITWDSGKITIKTPSMDGQTLIIDRSIDDIVKQISDPTPDNRTVTLTVDVKQPELDTNNLDKLGLKEVIGEGVSQWAGSAIERATNIKVGASYLTGKLIRPHSIFSFLDAVGEISSARGYVKGYAIIADQTTPDVGGGICQVSTTTFRAAFYAGLPIVERNAHIYRVSWYEELGEPVGFDAAVYQPGVDMKFENNTDNWMFLDAQIKDGKLYVRLIGTKVSGQTVDLVSSGIAKVTNPPPDRYEIDKTLGPLQRKQVDTARRGLTTQITRVIKVNGAVVKEDKFPTIFSPWPNIYKLGPAYAGPDGKLVLGPDGKPVLPTPTPAAGDTTPPASTQPANPATTPAPPPTTKKP
ncbi:MAG: VanW family protein [Chloroflexi bacterium]|uniref:VanW family protein n=1 Tax=Candidatus Chlorohelix allophototropha TaxID=3003348 RepID=A0A8T7M5K4_9CHLR|nr:VanW family protein [Chloroflexota bacterium]WJW69190.1 VanW family protein [Chloroflexota bacterium L227-S17]